MRGGYHATTDHRLEVAPPASWCERATVREDHPRGHAGGGRAPWAPGASVSSPEQKKTWVVRQASQYFSDPGPHGSEPRSKKTTSGRELKRRGRAERTRGSPQNGRMRLTKGTWAHRIVAIWKPKAWAAANQRLGPAPLISQHPRSERYFRNPRTRS